MSKQQSERSPGQRPGVAPGPRLLPLWMLYGWAVLGAAYLVLLRKGPAWLPAWPANWWDALDALAAVAALTIGLVELHRQGIIRTWVLAMWFVTLAGCGLYSVFR